MVRPCPFCNSANVDLDAQAGTFYVCDDCGAEGPFTFDGPDAALALWNRRPGPDDGDRILPTNHGNEED